jgi:hypothetical protein
MVGILLFQAELIRRRAPQYFPQAHLLTLLGLWAPEPELQTPFLGVAYSVIRNLLRFSD